MPQSSSGVDENVSTRMFFILSRCPPIIKLTWNFFLPSRAYFIESAKRPATAFESEWTSLPSDTLIVLSSSNFLLLLSSPWSFLISPRVFSLGRVIIHQRQRI